MRQAVFLDRDGVLNRPILRNCSPGSPRYFEEFELLDGAVQCVNKLRSAGLLVIVVTNQPDVARGLLEPTELVRMHHWLKQATLVNAVYTCPHDDRDACSCRKPKPGLLLRAAEEWDIALTMSYMVGDSWKDIEAGTAAGCQTILVEPILPQTREVRPTYNVRNLPDATEMIATLLGVGSKTRPR